MTEGSRHPEAFTKCRRRRDIQMLAECPFFPITFSWNALCCWAVPNCLLHAAVLTNKAMLRGPGSTLGDAIRPERPVFPITFSQN